MKMRSAVTGNSAGNVRMITDRYGAGLMINALVEERKRLRKEGADLRRTDVLILKILNALDISAGRK